MDLDESGESIEEEDELDAELSRLLVDKLSTSASSQQHSGGEACQLDGLPVQRKKAYLSGESMPMQLFLKDNIEL